MKRKTQVTETAGLTRREIIAFASTSAGLSVLPSAIQGANNEGLVDAHAHVWTSDTDTYPLAAGFQKSDMQPPTFTPSDLMRHARPAGVTRVVLIQMSYYGFDNSYMLDVMRRGGGAYAGVAVVDEHQEPAKKMIDLARHGVKGFRIRPGKLAPADWLSNAGMRSMWKCGAENALAICPLIDPQYLPSLERMCGEFPGTPVVIDHFARIGVDGEIRRSDLEHLCRLSRYPNVSVKASAFYALGKKQIPYNDLTPMIERVFDAYGPQRMMWASDCPFQVLNRNTYHASIDLIKNQLRFLTANDRDWILRKTAERVFFS